MRSEVDKKQNEKEPKHPYIKIQKGPEYESRSQLEIYIMFYR
jgi:hypothetical protein